MLTSPIPNKRVEVNRTIAGHSPTQPFPLGLPPMIPVAIDQIDEPLGGRRPPLNQALFGTGIRRSAREVVVKYDR